MLARREDNPHFIDNRKSKGKYISDKRRNAINFYRYLPPRDSGDRRGATEIAGNREFSRTIPLVAAGGEKREKVMKARRTRSGVSEHASDTRPWRSQAADRQEADYRCRLRSIRTGRIAALRYPFSLTVSGRPRDGPMARRGPVDWPIATQLTR